LNATFEGIGGIRTLLLCGNQGGNMLGSIVTPKIEFMFCLILFHALYFEKV